MKIASHIEYHFQSFIQGDDSLNNALQSIKKFEVDSDLIELFLDNNAHNKMQDTVKIIQISR